MTRPSRSPLIFGAVSGFALAEELNLQCFLILKVVNFVEPMASNHSPPATTIIRSNYSLYLLI